LELKRQLGLPTSILVVVASMIGTGIFITTGEVLGMTHNALIILALWIVAVVVALTGSLCYAELATMWPHVGGEYIYLKNTFGLLPSFLTGWISLVVGFTACVAISSITVVEYLHQFFLNTFGQQSGLTLFFTDPWNQRLMASSIIFFFGALHIIGVKTGSRIQNILTIFKLFIITLLIVFGFAMVDWSNTDRLTSVYPLASGESTAGIPTIGLCLLIIMFSYTGWNGAAYLAGEIKKPERNLPLALLIGTIITSLLYLLLNVIFLMSSPGTDIMGQKAIGAIATKHLFGIKISNLFTLTIAILLLSSISVEIMIGPRVYYAMAKDKMLFQGLSSVSSRFQTPAFAITLQVALSIFYVFIGNTTILMEYMGFALGIFPVLTVIGLMYMRYKHPDMPRPFKVPLYPVVPIIFIVISLFMMTAGFIAWTSTSKFALMVILTGIPVFYIWRWVQNKRYLMKSSTCQTCVEDVDNFSA
jgi:basic amino acid/polyamine antiporter, APA family